MSFFSKQFKKHWKLNILLRIGRNKVAWKSKSSVCSCAPALFSLSGHIMVPIMTLYSQLSFRVSEFQRRPISSSVLATITCVTWTMYSPRVPVWIEPMTITIVRRCYFNLCITSQFPNHCISGVAKTNKSHLEWKGHLHGFRLHFFKGGWEVGSWLYWRRLIFSARIFPEGLNCLTLPFLSFPKTFSLGLAINRINRCVKRQECLSEGKDIGLI